MSKRPQLQARRQTQQPAQRLNQQANNLEMGSLGEKQAIQFLQKNNYQILSRNFKFKKLEIDIIALDKKADVIAFVEVKKRSSAYFGSPAAAVNFKKLQHLKTAGQVFLQQHKIDKNFRFDIISILPNQVEHFKNISINF